jgi:hypothetical protein
VVGVGVPVEQGRPARGREGVEDFRIPSFGDVGHALEHAHILVARGAYLEPAGWLVMRINGPDTHQ